MTEHETRDGGPDNGDFQEARLAHQETYAEIMPVSGWQAYSIETLNSLLDS